MRELPQAFWDALDDAPQRRAGGFILGMEGKPRVRSERRNAEYRSRFPRLRGAGAVVEVDRLPA